MQEAKTKEFQEYYRNLKAPFMRYAFSMTKDLAKAEDVVHESFLSAYAHWDSFQGNSARSTWLWSILRNTCLQQFRKSEFKYETLNEEVLVNTPDAEEALDIKLINDSESKQVEQALLRLSAPQREVLELRMADIPLEEISLILKMPVSTIKSHIHRAKKALLQILKENS